MILAAGLTPAWQQILVFDHFQVGEVNRAVEARWCSSGKVINAGLALHHLGATARTLALAGGQPRHAMEAELDEHGVQYRMVAAERPTRVCTTILDQSTGQTTELVENAGPVSSAELDAFRTAFVQEVSAAEMVLLTGSLPKGTPADFYRDLLSQTTARAVIDASGKELLAALDARPFLVKPNRQELARTLDLDLATDQALIAAMLELNRQGASWVVVTGGARLVWIAGEGQVFSVRPIEVPVVNPIGCGDCLAAGIAWACDAGEEPLSAIRLGMAAAAENAAGLLPARLDPRRVRQQAETIARPVRFA